MSPMNKTIKIALIISLLSPFIGVAHTTSTATTTPPTSETKRSFCDRLVKKEGQLEDKDQKKDQKEENKEEKELKKETKKARGNKAVLDAVKKRQEAFRAARNKRMADMKATLEKALADCKANKDPQIVKKEFQNAKKSARKAFKAAIKKARKEFKAAIQKIAHDKDNNDDKDDRGKGKSRRD